jgi:hypothetical protein
MLKRRRRFSYSKYINLNPTTDDSVNGRKTNTMEEVKKRYQDDPSHREWGTDSLTDIYKNDTPGQEPKLKRFKQFVEMNEVTIRTADNKLKKLENVPIRMASGEIKSMPPGKSGSSGGGDGG